MKLKNSTNGKISLLDLLIVILAGFLAYQLYTRGKLDQYLPEQYRYSTRVGAQPAKDDGYPASAPVPKPPTVAATASAPAPQTAPAASAAPARTTNAAPAAPAVAAPAQPASLAELRALPRHRWPKQVAIRREMEVPIVSGGRIAGSMKAQPGTVFELVDIQDAGVSIKVGEQVKTLPVGETDILVRFHQIKN